MQVVDELNASMVGIFTVAVTDVIEPPTNSDPVALNNSNFQTAVNLWFTNQAEAVSTYGHIRDWNTSAVTDMSNAFKDGKLQ